MNWYAYAGGDPINHRDPSGTAPCNKEQLEAGWKTIGTKNGPECLSNGGLPEVTVAGFGDGASFGLTITARAIIGGNENVDFGSHEYQIAAAFGAAAGTYLFSKGAELKIGNNFRFAPYGNRTGNPYGEFPHYHRRITDPAGNTIPGGGIGRHRPWEPPPTGTPWSRRF